ncbi:MAG TPA: hypothetical protein VFQ21_07300 [Gemmatimonadota bacterium]|nr:hypothetical protein [Gemmatimonadota bacterium]
MRAFPIAALLLVACASVPRDEGELERRAIYEGYTVEQVRAAAVATLSDLSRFIAPARVAADGRVVSEYAANGWTSYEVGFEELAGGVAAEVRIVTKPQLDCPGRSAAPVSAAQVAAARAPDGNGPEGYPVRSTPLLPRVALVEPDCEFRTRHVRSDNARVILDRIRTRLESSH